MNDLPPTPNLPPKEKNKGIPLGLGYFLLALPGVGLILLGHLIWKKIEAGEFSWASGLGAGGLAVALLAGWLGLGKAWPRLVATEETAEEAGLGTVILLIVAFFSGNFYHMGKLAERFKPSKSALPTPQAEHAKTHQESPPEKPDHGVQ